MADILEILIKFGLDASAAKRAATEIGNLKSASAGANKELSEGAKRSAASQGELKQILNQLKTEFPILGLLGRAAMNGMVGGTLLALYAMRQLSEQIKSLEILLQPSEWKGRFEAIAAGKKAWEDQQIAAAGFWHELNRIDSKIDSIIRKSGRLSGSVDRTAGHELELRQAEKERELAGLDPKDEAGRAAIEKKYQDLEATAKITSENKKLNALLQERTQILDRVSQLERELPGMQDAAAKASAEIAQNDAERAIHTQNIASANAKIAQYEEEQEKRSKFGMRSALYDKLTDADVSRSLESEIAARDAAQRALDKLNRERVGRESAGRAVISDAAAAEAELRGGRSRVRFLDEEAKARTDAYIESMQFNDRIVVQRAATGTGDLGGLMLGAAEGADAIRAGGRATAQQAQQMNALIQLYGWQNQNIDTVIKFLSMLNNDQQHFAQQLEILRSQIKARR